MTDYLRPMAAYVATLGGHHNQPHRTQLSTLDTGADIPDTQADTTVENADTRTERGWTR
ncbi:hypothetical protein [Nocardia yunnanensis]|uniref:hypothetical protein n=1 Tax=Nocardia yunnanensis TaxID=2382165 RepID=UPI0013C4E696|nr:hypothetical protein [Nocardia yunnanensis]